MSAKTFLVCETVHGTYSYHLRKPNSMKPLCDSSVGMMHTEIPIEAWGIKTHLNERYCVACKTLSERVEQ